MFALGIIVIIVVVVILATQAKEKEIVRNTNNEQLRRATNEIFETHFSNAMFELMAEIETKLPLDEWTKLKSIPEWRSIYIQVTCSDSYCMGFYVSMEKNFSREIPNHEMLKIESQRRILESSCYMFAEQHQLKKETGKVLANACKRAYSKGYDKAYLQGSYVAVPR